MSIFGNRLKYVTCRTWDVTNANFDYPERSDDELKVPEVLSRPEVGIAFSGGGTRSASASLGYLRGLYELGLLSKIQYLSCVSGGAWACVPFTFLPKAMSDRTFLGHYIPPKKLTEAHLRNLDKNSFASAIADSVIFDNFLKNAIKFAGDETYSRAIGETFVAPLGLEPTHRFFSQSAASVKTILARNDKMRADDFHPVRPGRPYLIVGGTILRPENEEANRPTRFHFEMTPLYVGTRVLHKKAGSSERDIGGYIEPFGFDSDAPENAPDANNAVRVRLGKQRHRFTLSDVVGTSGAAPAKVLAKVGLDWLGFPEFKHWPTTEISKVRSREYIYGDGGILENLGIMPLLMRKVKKIVVFINTRHPVISETDINGSLPPLFGQMPDFKTNHVFTDGTNHFRQLVNGLLKAKHDGETVMFKDEYRVKTNKHYGIEGGWDVEVLWVYNERVDAWEDLLGSDLRDMIGHGSLGNFPHYETFFQNPPTVIDLSAKQVSMLAHLASWNVMSNAETFRQMLS